MYAPAPPKRNDRPAPVAGPGATDGPPRARVGDETAVRATAAEVAARNGAIVGPRHPDGIPHDEAHRADEVRRAGGGRVTPYVPGRDAYVRQPATGGVHDPAP
ncbi:hypothetical protein [Streptomyces sp. NPDC003374]